MDTRIFFASANQAELSGPFPQNIDQSWEVKPLGNRFIVYSLYILTIQFVDFQDKYEFEIAVKLIYGFFILITSLFFLHETTGIWKKVNLPQYFPLFIILISFYSLSFFCALQAEDFCSVLVLIALSLIISPNRALNILAGFPIAFLFAVKGVTILLGLYFIPLFLILGPEYQSKIKYSIYGFVISISSIFLLFAFVFHYAFGDMVFATIMQDTNNYYLFPVSARILQLFIGLYISLKHIPILIPGIISAIGVLFYLVNGKKWRFLLLFLSLGFIGSSIIIIQGKFFSYHYLVFFLLAIGSILTFFVLYPKWRIPIIILIVLLWAIFQLPYSINYSLATQNLQDTRDYFSKLDERYNLSSESDLLYLDNGMGAYYLSAPSHCRFFWPPSSNAARSQEYKGYIKCVLTYNGEYIIINPDKVKIDNLVTEKLNREYTEVPDQLRFYNKYILLKRVLGFG